MFGPPGATEVVFGVFPGWKEAKNDSGSDDKTLTRTCAPALSGNRQPVLQAHDGRVALLPPRGPHDRRPAGEEAPPFGPVRGGGDGP